MLTLAVYLKFSFVCRMQLVNQRDIEFRLATELVETRSGEGGLNIPLPVPDTIKIACLLD